MNNPMSINDYEHYLRELVEIYQSSNETNSIIMEFYFNDNDCKTAVKRINEDGTQELLKVSNFTLEANVKPKFLTDTVTSYILYNDIFSSNIVSDSNNSMKNMVAIVTKKNDKFNINGLNVEIANKLLDEITIINEEKKK